MLRRNPDLNGDAKQICIHSCEPAFVATNVMPTYDTGGIPLVFHVFHIFHVVIDHFCYLFRVPRVEFFTSKLMQRLQRLLSSDSCVHAISCNQAQHRHDMADSKGLH